MTASPEERRLTGTEAEARLERLRVLEAVLDAAGRLAEAGPVSEIVDRAPAECARALDLDRVVLSRVDDGSLGAEAVHCAEGAGDAAAVLDALRDAPVRLGYPLLEAERPAALGRRAVDDLADRAGLGEAVGGVEHRLEDAQALLGRAHRARGGIGPRPPMRPFAPAFAVISSR